MHRRRHGRCHVRGALRRAFVPALLLALVAGSGAGPAWAQPDWAKLGTAKPAAEPVSDGFRVQQALFTRERATGYGMYVPRDGARFKQGESLLFYMEPAGYEYKQDGKLFRFGAQVDLKLTQDGKVLYSKDGFLNAAFSSHHRNKEIDFTGSFDLTGAPAGEYVLELSLKDTYSNGTATVSLPFTLE